MNAANKNKLAAEHLNVASMAVNSMRHLLWTECDEAHSECLVAVVKASRKWKKSFGVPFRSYAFRACHNAICNFIRERNRKWGHIKLMPHYSLCSFEECRLEELQRRSEEQREMAEVIDDVFSGLSNADQLILRRRFL